MSGVGVRAALGAVLAHDRARDLGLFHRWLHTWMERPEAVARCKVGRSLRKSERPRFDGFLVRKRFGSCEESATSAGVPSRPNRHRAQEAGPDGVTVPRIAPHLLVGIRILVVDDDDDSRHLAQILSLEGATVQAVSTASEALAMLPGADLVLTDFALPSDDGVWLLERVNKEPRPIPVIVMSSFDEGQEPRLTTAPFAGKLLKPVDFDRLYAEIATALGRSRVTRSILARAPRRAADDGV